MHLFPAILVSQPLGDFYICALPAATLLEVSYPNPFKLMATLPSGHYQFEGSQRELDPTRLKEIGRYLQTSEAALPNAIILAANYDQNGILVEDESKRWSVVPHPLVQGIYELRIPEGQKLAAIVDGQHRLYGFEEAAPAQLSMPLVCSIFLDLPNPLQATVFATINFNQKPVNKSQTYQLYGFNLEEEPPQSWSPEKLAVFLTRRLNVDSKSPFVDRIIVAAQDERSVETAATVRKKTWSMSTATLVEGILSLISSNPKFDRDAMHRASIASGRHRKLAATARDSDESPCRDLYIGVQDMLLYTLILNYFIAVAETFWNSPERDPGYARKTIGIQAFFDLLKKLAPKRIAEKDISVGAWKALLAPAADIDFKDNFFSASGTGHGRARDSLFLALALKKQEDVKSIHLPDFVRLKAIKPLASAAAAQD